ncbi:MAG: sulfite exporter TauE/SafE family protein [Candidatus Berkelbacteria bacterium]|nr:MAG: sulfite exporter TauE/SafE family protein [Candidatus Berkelbacteria bacterium]QQG51956.1 MAG: sulfite exporter TauE/SafE family protein [Candidatus Berkelbacteria bacterium]
MPNLWVIFLTGLTTGGLSCLAVQGGLLANVIAKQAEDEFKPNKPKENRVDPAHMSKHDLINFYEHHQEQPRAPRSFRSDITLSIVLFLAAKIVAYTLLGLGLGWLGTMLQLTPVMRGVLMLAITIFMLGTALRLLNVHPFFNYFQIQPPKFIRRFIRRFSKNAKEDYATPIFLGALTVLIPCGITQAMMALALGTGSPVAGALILFSFTLGASPLFFILAYFTTRLGESLNKYFVRIVAVLVLIFSLYSLESGLNLVGSPVSYAAYKQWLDTPVDTIGSTEIAQQTKANEQVNDAAQSEQKLTISVQEDGYEPNILKAKAGVPTRLTLVTKDTFSCSRAFVIPSLKIQKVLPETGRETINIPAQDKGRLRFSCSMGMYTGQILFE